MVRQVEIDWCSHQHTLSQQMIYKINGGASRVLIIRNATPAHSEKLIREHAGRSRNYFQQKSRLLTTSTEHIDKLVVIGVVFQGKDIVVECNSVHNANFLKMCLVSRGKFKRQAGRESHD